MGEKLIFQKKNGQKIANTKQKISQESQIFLRPSFHWKISIRISIDTTRWKVSRWRVHEYYRVVFNNGQADASVDRAGTIIESVPLAALR